MFCMVLLTPRSGQADEKKQLANGRRMGRLKAEQGSAFFFCNNDDYGCFGYRWPLIKPFCY
jgi:hypothetical protein